MMKKLYTLFTFLLLTVAARAHTLNGIVTDENAVSIPGAKVSLPSMNKQVLANTLGEFVLTDVHLGDSLIIEAGGYEKRLFILDREKYFQADYVFILYPQVKSLEEVNINESFNTLSRTANIDLNLQPVRSSQDLLTLVPGLFIAQHAGGGKAEQLFLRGFDIDHGTDVALSLDGMPVNMVSHAHGQGYSDMHFIMPEVIDRIDFGKGPYDVTKGNFATAGHVDFQTRDRLQNNLLGLEYGMFNHKRITSAINILNGNNGQNAYFATDYMLTDNYFDSPQDFKRINLFAKYTGMVSPTFKLSAQISTFSSSWNASGQIPERAVQSGIISRFGAIDNTEGGETSRTNLQIGLVNKLSPKSILKSDFFVSDYQFTLYSNFTFFLEDAINGDQIRQSEKRRVYGGKTEWKRFLSLNDHKLTITSGAGFRYDDINDIGLAKTTNRKIVREQVQLGDIDETNLFGYVSAELEVNKFIFNVGLRADNFNFYYVDKLDSLYNPRNLSQSVALPKVNVFYNVNKKVQLYLKSGIGYHSNDTRVVLANDNLNRKVLPLAYGSDLGFTYKPNSKLLFNGAAWYLYSEQEFVYVGDAGVVEPSGSSERIGFDFGTTFQPLNWLFIYANVNYAHARSVTDPEGQNYIPLAPKITSNGKAQVNFKNGLYASLAYKYMGDRPANEDNSVIARGYFVNDFTLGLQKKSFVISGTVQNIFNVAWNETQFLTESRLKDELQPVEEIHFTPGTPFNFRAQVKFLF